MLRNAVVVLGCVGVLAACAPKPAPVMPEPKYDKFGNVESVCVSDAEIQDPNYRPPVRPLPRCEDRCKQGEQPTFTVAGQWPVCVPRRPNDNGGNDRETTPNPNNQPTRG